MLRFHSPAAERNKAPILEVLRRVLPRSGTVLEIASGSGQHLVYFSKALPELIWQPSEADEQLRQAIRLQLSAEPLANVNMPVTLDAARWPWPIDRADAIVCINMLHIAPWAATQGLLAGAGRLLPQGGVLYLYGPFRRSGRHSAASNEAFDRGLRRQDPAWGVRDTDDIERLAERAGFSPVELTEMPANNLSLVFRKPGVANR